MMAKAKNASPLFKLLLLGTSSSSFFAYHLHSKCRANQDDSHMDLSLRKALVHHSGQQRFSELKPLANSMNLSNGVATNLVKEKQQYYEAFQKLPNPTFVHDSLDRLLRDQSASQYNINPTSTSDKVLIIGDVHGCLNELKQLVEKAKQQYNSNKNFRAVILVGDLCNKGPLSAQVIRYVKDKNNWFSVRGNHDNGALEAVLGDNKRRSRPKYRWVQELTNDDIEWMSELPYTIKIPKDFFKSSRNTDRDVIVVHAGFVRGKPIAEQDFKTMTTIRDVISTNNDRKSFSYFDKKRHTLIGNGVPLAWASIWEGKETVIFGHDAKRGLQKETRAIGLDSGAVYGKRLTGIVLPDYSILSVESEKAYSSI
jgi:predicted phosphodiesterase